MAWHDENVKQSKGAVVAEIAVDVVKVGLAAVPLVGGSVVEVLEILDARRLRRVELLRAELVDRLSDRLDEVEKAMRDDRIVDLIDDAVEKAARTRSDAQIRLLADVVALAVLGRTRLDSPEPSHVLLATIASLRPAHIEILIQLGTRRNINGQTIAPVPSTGPSKCPRDISMRLPHLASVLTPLLQDLRNGGLAEPDPSLVSRALGGVLAHH